MREVKGAAPIAQPCPVSELEAIMIEEVGQRDAAVAVRAVVEALSHKRPPAEMTAMTVMDNRHCKGYLEQDGPRRPMSGCCLTPRAPQVAHACRLHHE